MLSSMVIELGFFISWWSKQKGEYDQLQNSFCTQDQSTWVAQEKSFPYQLVLKDFEVLQDFQSEGEHLEQHLPKFLCRK